MKTTLNQVNQTLLAEKFGVTKKTINRILWKAKDLKLKFLESPTDLKRSRSTQYGAIEEKVVAFVTMLRNRPKPLPVSFSMMWPPVALVQVISVILSFTFCALVPRICLLCSFGAV